jgi:ribosomal 50S subunit-recycling heat shock protein
MAKFIVSKDIAILDRGVGSENRFVAIEGVSVDEYGSLSPQSLKATKRALSNEAVKNGAVRINQSDCVDMSGGLEASDDMIIAYNENDIIYTSLQSGFAIEKFMIKNELLIPAKKQKNRSIFSRWFS